jgi:hypothetical protein
MKATTSWLVASVAILLAGMANGKDTKKPGLRYPLTAREIRTALSVGTKAKGRNCGLALRDSFQGFSNAMAAMGDGRTGSTGFSVDVYTPFSWIAQNASWEAKRYRELRPEDVTEEMRQGVLRVYANPDMPTRVSSDGMIGASGVDHIIIRSTRDRDFEVAQPLETQEDVAYARNAFGAEVGYASLVGYFDLEEVRRISALDKKGEFFVVVIGTTGEEKKFKVKTKHFDELP